MFCRETWGPGIQVDDTWPIPPTQTLPQTKFTSSWQQHWPPIKDPGNYNNNQSAWGCCGNDAGICHYIRWWCSFPQKHEKWTAIISNNHAVKSWSRQFISVWLSTASSSIDSAQRLWCTSYSGLDIVVVCRAVSEAKDTSTCDVSGQRTEMHL